MRTKTIEITITPDGDCNIDLQNFHGKGCHEVMQDFTAPGDKLKKTIVKREYHESVAKEKERVKAGGKA